MRYQLLSCPYASIKAICGVVVSSPIDLSTVPELTDLRVNLKTAEINFAKSAVKNLKIAGLKSDSVLENVKSLLALMIVDSPLESFEKNIDVLGVYNVPKLQHVSGSNLAMFDSEKAKSLVNLNAPNTVILKILGSPIFDIEKTSINPGLVSLWLAKIAPIKELSWLYKLKNLVELIFDDKNVPIENSFIDYVNSMELKNLRAPEKIGRQVNISPDDWGFLLKVSPRVKELCELYRRCRFNVV